MRSLIHSPLGLIILGWLPVIAWSAPRPAETGGLEPCNSTMNAYYAEVHKVIASRPRGLIVGTFTAYPSFQPEWGAILFELEDAFILRVVEFKQSVWHSAWQESSPGQFDRDPTKAVLDRSIDEVEVSRELAQLVRQVLANEVTAASEMSTRWGLDGETYRFTSAGQSCACTWSPEAGSRPAQFIHAFESLRTLARVPTRWLRGVWESSVLAKWRGLEARIREPAISGA